MFAALWRGGERDPVTTVTARLPLMPMKSPIEKAYGCYGNPCTADTDSKSTRLTTGWGGGKEMPLRALKEKAKQRPHGGSGSSSAPSRTHTAGCSVQREGGDRSRLEAERPDPLGHQEAAVGIGNRAAEPGEGEAGAAGPRLRKEGRRTSPPESHQVDGVEDLHLSDGGAARIRQVTVVIVDGERTQACEQHTGTRRVRAGPLAPPAAGTRAARWGGHEL